MTDLRALVLWPPQVPSYFNAGHHLQVFLVSAYLRSVLPHWKIDAIDAGALNFHWKKMADTFHQGAYSLIAVANDLDSVDGLARVCAYAREFCPDARIVTFGRLSSLHAGLFQQFDLDAIVWSGDYEPGVAEAASLVEQNEWRAAPGLIVRNRAGSWSDPVSPGVALSPEDWALPDVREIPYENYDRLYANDDAKFCGIPERRELVVPVARGCPVGCQFCDVPDVFGLRERRLSVERTVRYIDESFDTLPFEYAAFYAPTFTLQRRWVRDLCVALEDSASKPKWKCATTVKHLDEELVGEMARAGCIRISVGLETLDAAGHPELPKVKRYVEDDFRQLADWCNDAGIELNAFVMVALPGTTPEGTLRTFEFAKSLGARVRPTMYTPYHNINDSLDVEHIGRFNRHFVHEAGPVAPALWYEFLFGSGLPNTRVQEKVPRRESRTPIASLGRPR